MNVIRSLIPRLPSFFGSYAKESTCFHVAAKKGGKPGDEAMSHVQ